MALISAQTLTPSPWKNGGGVTREIAIGPAGSGFNDFVWRISLADITVPGPFSQFDGIDRCLALIDGAGLTLRAHSGISHKLTRPLEFLNFAGETAMDARLSDGVVRVFNLMLRRGFALGHLEKWQSPRQAMLKADTVLLFCPNGPVEVQLDQDERYQLMTLDTLRLDAAHARHCRMIGDGLLLVACIDVLKQ